jgi:hypothetical protein
VLEAQIQSATIVLIGQFNPAIFSPSWLQRVGLIKELEAEAAEVTIIHAELTSMKVGSVELQIGPQRLAASTPEVPFVRVQEFVTDLIGGILPHTPIAHAGINFEEHFVAPSPRHRIALGRLLAPVAPWGEWGEAIEADPDENPSGLMRLTMRENNPDSRSNGWFAIEIAPSTEINKFQAVKISSNDHYVVEETKFASSAESAAAILSENFDKSQKKALSIFNHIRELTAKVVL